MIAATSMPLLADRDSRIPAHFKDDATTEKLLHILRKIFPRDEVLAYFFQICTFFLYNGNPNKYSYVFSGPDYNGKDFVIKLLENIFPSEVLTDLKSSTLFGNKIFFLDGDRAQIEIDGGIIKRITGGDSQHYRIGSFVRIDKVTEDAFPKLVFLCQAGLPVTDSDEALNHRLVYLPFIARDFNFRHFSSEEMKEFALSMKWLILQTVPRTTQDFPPPLVQEYVRRLTPLY